MLWNTEKLFEQAMSIKSPWYIEKTDFKADWENLLTGWELHIRINFKRWAKFFDGDTNKEYGVYNTKKKTYRHLNFFQYPT